MKKISLIIAGLIIIGGIIYGSTIVVKQLSYSWFYKDMVEQTVRDMVKPEYLKAPLN